MSKSYSPNMTWSWVPPQVTSPGQPQNRTVPSWGAVGSPTNPGANYDPNSPLALARKAVGLGGFGAVDMSSPAWRAYSLLTFVSGCAAGYHGFKRNNGSIGWALTWWFFGGLAPLITLPVAAFQGYAKPARRR